MKESTIKKLIKECQDEELISSSVSDPEDLNWMGVTFRRHQWPGPEENGRVKNKIEADYDRSNDRWTLYHVERLGEDKKISLKKARGLLHIN